MTGFTRFERALLVIALVFFIIIAVKETVFFVSILVASFFLSLLCLPCTEWLERKGTGHAAAVGIVTVAGFLVVVAFCLLAFLSFHTLVADLPQYQDDLSLRLADLSGLFSSLGISAGNPAGATPDIKSIVSLAASSVMGISEAVIFLFFVAVTTFFILLEAPLIAARFRELGGSKPAVAGQVSRMAGYVIDFIVVRTETNFIHGVLFGGFLGIMGVHAAVLWGILVFLLGYIPYIGLIIASIPAIFFAWLQFGIWGAAAVIAAVCILNLIVENPVYSYLAAKKFEVPALVVIISVIFWGWLLGLVGMLFAIPLTLVLVLVFQLFDETRWINRVLGLSHLFEEAAPAEVQENKTGS